MQWNLLPSCSTWPGLEPSLWPASPTIGQLIALCLSDPLLHCSSACAVKVLGAQSFPALCEPMDCRPPGSSVHGLLQARILEWVIISFSRGFSWPGDRTQVSCIPGRFFTVWATGETLFYLTKTSKLRNRDSGNLDIPKRNHKRPPERKWWTFLTLSG